jgi:hypothetical protein
MLLVKYLPQPPGLVENGDAYVPEARVHREASCGAPRRELAALSQWPESVFQL